MTPVSSHKPSGRAAPTRASTTSGAAQNGSHASWFPLCHLREQLPRSLRGNLADLNCFDGGYNENVCTSLRWDGHVFTRLRR